jgi:hypothetical protein
MPEFQLGRLNVGLHPMESGLGITGASSRIGAVHAHRRTHFETVGITRVQRGKITDH